MRIVRIGITQRGFKAINLFGVLFARKGARLSDVDMNHEEIHTAQMKELLYVPFYVCYGIEWMVRFVLYTIKSRKMMGHTAYKNASFEREAYGNQNNIIYLEGRERYAWTKYITKKEK